MPDPLAEDLASGFHDKTNTYDPHLPPEDLATGFGETHQSPVIVLSSLSPEQFCQTLSFSHLRAQRNQT